VLSRSQLERLLFAAVTAFASHFVVHGLATPIDRALPLVVIVISICALAAQRFPAPFQIAILLLFLPPMFLADEHTRLLAYGVMGAGAFAFALAVAPAEIENALVLTVAGVVLLRWIPFAQISVWRELVVLAGAIALITIGRLKPAAALMVVLVTPIVPARMILFPFLVAVLAAVPIPRIAIAAAFAIAAPFARYSIGVLCVAAAIALLWSETTLLNVPAYAAAIGLFALWPWSGVVARALPPFLVAEPASNAKPVWIALARSQSFDIQAPPDARAITITASLANGASLPEGRVVGMAGSRQIAIGDVADFGFLRREHFFASHNRPPRTPLADVKDYGAAAWLHAAGRIRMPLAGSTLRVTAAPDLPPAVRLQIETVEFE
jgi:MFS family permease